MFSVFRRVYNHFVINVPFFLLSYSFLHFVLVIFVIYTLGSYVRGRSNVTLFMLGVEGVGISQSMTYYDRKGNGLGIYDKGDCLKDINGC